MTAIVRAGRRSSRSNTAWPHLSSISSSATSVTPRNCAMSAPATKPAGLAERMTTPRGESRSSLASTSLSSASTSSDKVLAPASCLSNNSQTMPSGSVRMRQCAHGPASCCASSLSNGPSSRLRLPRMASAGLAAGVPVMVSVMVRRLPSNRFDQHGAALAAADAFGGDAAPLAEPLHGIDQMQHDAIAAGADRMADADGAAVDIEPVARDVAGSAGKAERVAAEFVVLPGGKAAQHLRGERFVELPQFDVVEREAVPPQQRGRAIDRAQSHDARIERRPFAVDDHRLGRELV